MNILSIVTSLFLLVGFPDPSTNNNLQHADISKNIVDTIPKFIVDDYPVTDAMLGANIRSRKSGEITEDEGAWFSNDTLNRTLVFILYTDYHRLYTFHFLNNDIPPGLINKMELHSNGETASNKLKQKYFKGFVTQTTKIGKSNFKTNKGFRLGDSKEKALKIYGKPTKKKIENGIERYEWEFVGDITYEYERGKTDLKGKPLAENSFDHQTTMFFRNNKLIGLIFHNDIP